MFCPKCSHQVTDSDKFCSQCGSADPAANAEWLKKVQERMSDPEYRKRVEEEAKSLLDQMEDMNNSDDQMDDPEYRKWMEEMGIFNTAVQEEMDRLSEAGNTKKRLKREWTESERSQLLKEYESGESIEKMAAAHERTVNDVIRKLLSMHFLPEYPSWKEPWSVEENEAFKLEYSSGLPLKEIAKRHGRTTMAIAMKASELGVNPKEIIGRSKKEQAQ